MDGYAVFKAVERWSPSSDADSLRALSSVAIAPTHILDIGCGKGFSTRLLAQHTQAHIVAVDNEQSALDELSLRLQAQNIEQRVTLSAASMTDLPFAPASFDLIWAEGSAYIMGVEQALSCWQPLLRDNGYMVISDLVWLSANPSPQAQAFWAGEYPDMQNIDKRLAQMRQAGFEVIEHFTLSENAWADYYQPVKAQVAKLKPNMPNSRALADLEREIAIYEAYLGEFGYHFFILKKPN